MNNVTLVGRLATDPRLEATNGNPICTFRLAVDRGKQDGADFIPVKCFGAAAENHAAAVNRGPLPQPALNQIKAIQTGFISAP